MNNKGADQTSQVRRLICAFVVRIWQKQIFPWCGSYREMQTKWQINPDLAWIYTVGLDLPVYKLRIGTVIIAPLWKSGGYTGFALVLPEFCGSVIIQMKLEYLWGQLTNVEQMLYEASLGWGKGCIRFCDRLDENSGFHGNRKHPLMYNGENNVSTISL